MPMYIPVRGQNASCVRAVLEYFAELTIVLPMSSFFLECRIIVFTTILQNAK